LNKAITILTKHSGHQDKPAIMLNFTYNLNIVELIKTQGSVNQMELAWWSWFAEKKKSG
jgi:hypothetical protein